VHDGEDEGPEVTGGGRGGQWVCYSYCISFVILSFRRYSAPIFVPDGQSRILPGLPYTFLSLVAGWWGFPFGLIFTPWCVIENFSGGKVVPEEAPVFAPSVERTGVTCPACSSAQITFAMGRSRCGECGRVF
jgi:hypothetical protein